MINFIRLIRPLNILILVATMLCLGSYLNYFFHEALSHSFISFSKDFVLLIISTALIAMAGNVINDVYDEEADKINKPQKVIVGKSISKKTALVYYYFLNILGLIIITIVCAMMKNWLFLGIHSFTIFVLWFYSFKLKKTFLVGNITIALLTAIIPFLVGVFYQVKIEDISLIFAYPFNLKSYNYFPLLVGSLFAVFAFLLNLVREIIKDMQDMEGDKKIQSRSLPLVIGVEKTKSVILFLHLFLLIQIGWFYLASKSGLIFLKAFHPLVFSFLCIVFSLFLIGKSTYPKELKKSSISIKLAMIFGLLLPIYWLLLL